nr:MAG TPA: hypothetical protein [Caudoviricetes sp.]
MCLRSWRPSRAEATEFECKPETRMWNSADRIFYYSFHLGTVARC